MDRQIIYPGQIPLDTDLLNTNKNTMVALGRLAGAALGTDTITSRLAVTPTSPSSLYVMVTPGEIYSLQNVDDAAYGSLAADTADMIVKQGILQTTAQLACPAPGTVGYSVNYLIQAEFSETDGDLVALPYYNATDPSQALSGPSGHGAEQATVRQDLCVVSAVAGTANTTGSQTTPTPTGSNAIGLAVVTVTYGQANITSADIAQYEGAGFVPQSGFASNVAHAIYTKDVSGNADVTLTDQEGAYPLLTLTGALTGDINLIVPAVSRQRVINNQTSGAGYNITVTTSAGTGLAVPRGHTMALYCDGVNVLNQSSASIMPSAYADATGTSDAIVASYSVNTITLYDGYPLAVGITAPNASTTPTFTPSLNGIVQTTRNIVKFVGNTAVPLAPGDLQGDAELRYDLPNTQWILQNPATNVAPPGSIINFSGSTAPSGYLACPTAATNLSVASYPLLCAAIGITWGSGTAVTAGSFVVGTTYVIVTLGTTEFTTIGASTNVVGTVFVATGAGSGTGTASTDFGMPWFPADYAAVQANANVGTQTVGEVIAHTHSADKYNAYQLAGGSQGNQPVGGGVTGSTGGAANLAAGVRVLQCVKY